jgi:hypothetical protein
MASSVPSGIPWWGKHTGSTNPVWQPNSRTKANPNTSRTVLDQWLPTCKFSIWYFWFGEALFFLCSCLIARNSLANIGEYVQLLVRGLGLPKFTCSHWRFRTILSKTLFAPHGSLKKIKIEKDLKVSVCRESLGRQKGYFNSSLFQKSPGTDRFTNLGGSS